MTLTPGQLSLEKAIREQIADRRAVIAKLRLVIHDPKGFEPLRLSESRLDDAEQMLSSIEDAVTTDGIDGYLRGAEQMLEVERLNTSQFDELFKRGGGQDLEVI